MIAMMKVLLLALTIYSESGGTDPATMQLVADTVVNRVDSNKYPDTVEGVILQQGAYYISRYPHRTLSDLQHTKNRLVSRKEPHDKSHKVWNQAYDIASKSLKKGYKPRNKFTHFYSSRKKPKWAYGKREYVSKGMKFVSHY